MKVLPYEHYEYLGVWGLYHAFRSKKPGFDPEIILESRARVVTKQGSSYFYDPVDENHVEFDILRVRKALENREDVIHNEESVHRDWWVSNKRLTKDSDSEQQACAASGR